MHLQRWSPSRLPERTAPSNRAVIFRRQLVHSQELAICRTQPRTELGTTNTRFGEELRKWATNSNSWVELGCVQWCPQELLGRVVPTRHWQGRPPSTLLQSRPQCTWPWRNEKDRECVSSGIWSWLRWRRHLCPWSEVCPLTGRLSSCTTKWETWRDVRGSLWTKTSCRKKAYPMLSFVARQRFSW